MRESYLDRLSRVQKKKKLSVYLPPEVARALKKYAVDQDKNVSQVIEEMVREKLGLADD